MKIPANACFRIWSDNWMHVRWLGKGSSNITYDYKNSSIENKFLKKFQNFCRKHFLVTLYIWLLLYACVLAKVPKTRLHICEMRQRPIFSIQITKHHKNLDSTLFISKVVVHHTAIAITSSPLKTVQKQSTGKCYAHLLLKRCKIHFFELKLESNITFFSGCGRSEAVVDAKFYYHSTKSNAFLSS